MRRLSSVIFRSRAHFDGIIPDVCKFEQVFVEQARLTSPAKKGRLSLLINLGLLDRFEPNKDQIF